MQRSDIDYLTPQDALILVKIISYLPTVEDMLHVFLLNKRTYSLFHQDSVLSSLTGANFPACRYRQQPLRFIDFNRVYMAHYFLQKKLSDCNLRLTKVSRLIFMCEDIPSYLSFANNIANFLKVVDECLSDTDQESPLWQMTKNTIGIAIVAHLGLKIYRTGLNYITGWHEEVLALEKEISELSDKLLSVNVLNARNDRDMSQLYMKNNRFKVACIKKTDVNTSSCIMLTTTPHLITFQEFLNTLKTIARNELSYVDYYGEARESQPCPLGQNNYIKKYLPDLTILEGYKTFPGNRLAAILEPCLSTETTLLLARHFIKDITTSTALNEVCKHISLTDVEAFRAEVEESRQLKLSTAAQRGLTFFVCTPNLKTIATCPPSRRYN